MKIQVTFRPPRRESETVELPEGATVTDLAAAVNEPIHVVVALKNNAIVHEDTVLTDGDDITLLSAASGG